MFVPLLILVCVCIDSCLWRGAKKALLGEGVGVGLRQEHKFSIKTVELIWIFGMKARASGRAGIEGTLRGPRGPKGTKSCQI